jgi:hypothetical protein
MSSDTVENIIELTSDSKEEEDEEDEEEMEDICVRDTTCAIIL